MVYTIHLYIYIRKKIYPKCVYNRRAQWHHRTNSSAPWWWKYLLSGLWCLRFVCLNLTLSDREKKHSTAKDERSEFVFNSPKPLIEQYGRRRGTNEKKDIRRKPNENKKKKKKNILYIHFNHYVLSLANYFLLEIWWWFFLLLLH